MPTHTKNNRNTRTYSDLNFNFDAHPVTADITLKFDEEAIKQSLRNLLQIRHFEKPFHSDIGSPLRQLLFEPITPMTEHITRRTVIDIISNYEPRVNLEDVGVITSPENNSLYLSIVFKIVNTQQPLTLDLILERTR
jgi:phage baseplate assembly protein W